MQAPVEAAGAGAPTVRRLEIRPLTSFRFVIGALLFVHHAVNFHVLSAQPGVKFTDLTGTEALLRQGFAAVVFFFLLSGFTLAWNYGEAMARPGLRAVATFYGNRVASIWPIHVLAFSMAFVFYADDVLGHPLKFGSVAVAELFLFQAWLPLGGPDTISLGFNGPSWSLSALLFFYLLFPAIACLLAALSRARSWVLLAIPVGWSLFVTAMALGWRHDPYDSWFFHTYPPVRLVDFVAGVGLALLLLRRRQLHAAEGAPVRGRSLTWSALEVGSVGLLAAACLSSQTVPLTVRYSGWFIVPIGALVYVFANERGALSLLLSARPFVYLGRIAFPFLMLHVVVMMGLSEAGVYDRSTWLGNGLALPISLALAVAAHHWWEVPARRMLRRRFARLSDQLAGAPLADMATDERAA